MLFIYSLQARGVASASIVNPNLHGVRNIDLLVPEVVEYRTEKGLTTYPSDRIRLQGLINLTLKNSINLEERSYTLESPMVKAMYKGMKKMVLPFHTALIAEHFSLSGGNADDGVPMWSEIDATLKLKHCLLLEGHLKHFGHLHYRCKRNWASDRLMYQLHKSRRNGSFNRAACGVVVSSDDDNIGFSRVVVVGGGGGGRHGSRVCGGRGNDDDGGAGSDDDEQANDSSDSLDLDELLASRPGYLVPSFPLPCEPDVSTVHYNEDYRLD